MASTNFFYTDDEIWPLQKNIIQKMECGLYKKIYTDDEIWPLLKIIQMMECGLYKKHLYS